jgi:hypothetical protein
VLDGNNNALLQFEKQKLKAMCFDMRLEESLNINP